jgi:hypothetical protein
MREEPAVEGSSLTQGEGREVAICGLLSRPIGVEAAERFRDHKLLSSAKRPIRRNGSRHFHSSVQQTTTYGVNDELEAIDDAQLVKKVD